MELTLRHGRRWRLIAVLFAFASAASAQVSTRNDNTAHLLNLWFGEGGAAGLDRLTYENRDGGHSLFPAHEWPQLHVRERTEQEKKNNTGLGAATVVQPFAVIGNASMAAPAEKGGSIPRLYVTSGGAGFLANQFGNNNIYFYPSHQDHLPGWNGVRGWGDLFPTNHPCVVISQGSSGTDQPFIRAFIAAAAALPPDTQRRLISTRLLAPALQALFRQSNKQVRAEGDYFTGAAHPPVFRGEDIDEERFIRLAHNLTEFAIPPLVVLKVRVEGEPPQNGKDFFELPLINSERLADTPCVVARVFRGSAFRRDMIVSAQNSFDLQGRQLRYRWVLLQGDPARIRIETSPDETEARITVGWHPEMRSAAGLASHRVDIGVFATNGLTWSAPSFITFYMLPNEARFYSKEGRLEEICYERGNPDPGLPAADSLRWLNLGRKLPPDDASLAGTWLRKKLPSEAAEKLRTLTKELSARQDEWRELDADPTMKKQADAAKRELENAVKQRVTAKLEGGISLRDAVEKAMISLAAQADLFTASQDDLMNAARNAGNGAAMLEARKRAADFRVFLEDVNGRCLLRIPADKRTAGDLAVLHDFHLSVLALAVFPDFLERSNLPAFTERLLTSPKSWRDLPHYDETGKRTGWTRITNGREYEFDAEGRLLPEGRGGRFVEVKMVRDTATGLLLFAPR